MAGRTQSCWSLLILFSLLILTTEFEVREDEWEELSPDIAALHRLRGLSEHVHHGRPHKSASSSQSRAARSVSGADIYQNMMSFLDGVQDCGNFTALLMEKEKDFDLFLEDIDEQRTDDWLLTTSEISHSYSQKILVKTDGERSTNDRVQQEYSTDPYYSVIVSKECLLNDSCLPEADSYTVVKIFGSVSEGGQTVSGLSGSSLAQHDRRLPP
ncbi:uncharacterized protein LOC114441560 [Parambassis ranga]|uniref:Uncharacterized protein LOC114441560 n=1 Tax=Parambassis ranga TaxID=210632 RepID=A0A6P7J0Z2_9TELE|nr:uncharacterized protein LOC114441560 [Parambassis ranga]